MIAGTRTQKRKQAEEYIKNQVLLLKPGESLHSLRLLMQESGLGRSILESTIREMISSGLLAAKSRSCIYRTMVKNFSINVNVADIVVCSEINSLGSIFFSNLLENITDEATGRGYSIRIQRVDLTAMVEKYTELIEREKIRTAILITPHTDEIPKIFERAITNWISLFPRYLPCTGPAILDSPNAVPMQMEYLVRMGHRRIAFIGEVNMQSPAYVHQQRRESYYRMMAEYGFRTYPHWVTPGTYDENELYEQLDKMFAKEPHPTAIVTPDRLISPLYSQLNSRGFSIGKDISVIGFDDMEFNNSLRPRPTSLINSRKKTAKLVWDMLMSTTAGEKITDIRYTSLQLQTGESVACLNDKANLYQGR